MRSRALRSLVFLFFVLFMTQTPGFTAESIGAASGQRAADFKVTNTGSTDVTVTISIGLSYNPGSTQARTGMGNGGKIENLIGESKPFTVPRGQTRGVTVTPISAACVFPPDAVFCCARSGNALTKGPILVAQLRPGTNLITIAGPRSSDKPDSGTSVDRGFETEVTFSVRNATTKAIHPLIDILDSKGNILGSADNRTISSSHAGDRMAIAPGKTENVIIHSKVPEMAFPLDATFRCLVQAADGTVLKFLIGTLSRDSRKLVIDSVTPYSKPDKGREEENTGPANHSGPVNHSFLLKNNMPDPVKASIVIGISGLTQVSGSDPTSRQIGPNPVSGPRLGQTQEIEIPGKKTATLEFTGSVADKDLPNDAVFICLYKSEKRSGPSFQAIIGRLFQDSHTINLGSILDEGGDPGKNDEMGKIPIDRGLETEVVFQILNRSTTPVIPTLNILSADGKVIGEPRRDMRVGKADLPTVAANGKLALTVKSDLTPFPSDAKFRCLFRTGKGIYVQTVEGTLKTGSRTIECTGTAGTRNPEKPSGIDGVSVEGFRTAKITVRNNRARAIQVAVFIGLSGVTSYNDIGKAGDRSCTVSNALAESRPLSCEIAARSAKTIEVSSPSDQPFPRDAMFFVATSLGDVFTVPVTANTQVVNLGCVEDESGKNSETEKTPDSLGLETSVRFTIINSSNLPVSWRIEIRGTDGSLIADSEDFIRLKSSDGRGQPGSSIAVGGRSEITLDSRGEPFPGDARFRCLISNARGALVGLVEGSLQRDSRVITFTGTSPSTNPSGKGPGSERESGSTLPTSVRLTLTSHLIKAIDLEGRLSQADGKAALGLPVRISVPALGRTMVDFTCNAGIPPAAIYEFRGQFEGNKYIVSGRIDRDGLLVKLNPPTKVGIRP